MKKQAKTSPILVIGGIAAILVLVGFMYVMLQAVNRPIVAPTTPSNPTGNTNNPSISIVDTDAISNAAVGAGTTTYVVSPATGAAKFIATNTSYSGVSGDSVIAINDPAGNYLSDDTGPQTITNGAQMLSFQVYAFANTSVVIKDDPVSSANTITQGTTGTYNVTKLTTGVARTVGLILTGTAQKSTGKQFITLESPANTGTNLSSFTMTCNNVVIPTTALPGCLTGANAASKIVGWEIPAEVNGAVATCSVVIQPTATGGDCRGFWLLKVYAEQKYIASDNTLQEGVCDTTPNGQNANKYQDYQPITFQFS